jgi:hypothetical protein
LDFRNFPYSVRLRAIISDSGIRLNCLRPVSGTVVQLTTEKIINTIGKIKVLFLPHFMIIFLFIAVDFNYSEFFRQATGYFGFLSDKHLKLTKLYEYFD